VCAFELCLDLIVYIVKAFLINDDIETFHSAGKAHTAKGLLARKKQQAQHRHRPNEGRNRNKKLMMAN